MRNDRLRVGDAERDAVASALHEHFAQGRLTREELDERLTGALSAKTVGDLRKVTEDLPGPADAPLPMVTDGARAPGAGHPHRAVPGRAGPPWGPYAGGPPWAWQARRAAYRGRHPRVGPPIGVLLLALCLIAALGGGWVALPLFVLLWGAMAFHGVRRARRRHRPAG